MWDVLHEKHSAGSESRDDEFRDEDSGRPKALRTGHSSRGAQLQQELRQLQGLSGRIEGGGAEPRAFTYPERYDVDAQPGLNARAQQRPNDQQAQREACCLRITALYAQVWHVEVWH